MTRMKKLISLALACSFTMAAAVMPMTGAAAEMQVIDFSAAEGASYGGRITVCPVTEIWAMAAALLPWQAHQGMQTISVFPRRF